MNEDERQRILFYSEIDSEIKRLDFQRKRIIEYSPSLDTDYPSPTHDADYYMVLLRRLYRRIEASQHDSRVANLKGKYRDLYRKIKIRDHFEHDIDFETFPQFAHGITIIGSVVINPTNPHIISGDQQWLLNDDHEKLKQLMTEFIQLYPFAPKPEQKTGIIYRLLQRITRRICKK